jgi:hypothetical protein
VRPPTLCGSLLPAPQGSHLHTVPDTCSGWPEKKYPETQKPVFLGFFFVFITLHIFRFWAFLVCFSASGLRCLNAHARMCRLQVQVAQQHGHGPAMDVCYLGVEGDGADMGMAGDRCECEHTQ